MREYSFTEARQNFASILDKAKNEGVVGVDLGISSAEIVSSIREGRRSAPPLVWVLAQ